MPDDDASLYRANLVGADLTGAQIQGASVGSDYGGATGLSLSQLYSTASYQSKSLRAVSFSNDNFVGANFAGQNLAGASFYQSNLLSADFNHAVLTEAECYGTNFAGANLTGADARNALDFDFSTAITDNFIQPDGHVVGLKLGPGQFLVVHDDHPINSYLKALPVVIDRSFETSSGGELQFQFESSNWQSTIQFAAGIPITLGGTLDLEFADGIDPASLVGDTFDLFDWTGVAPTGQFTIDSPYQWDLSNLYTNGDITLAAVPEPSSMCLLAVGLIVLMSAPRRDQFTITIRKQVA